MPTGSRTSRVKAPDVAVTRSVPSCTCIFSPGVEDRAFGLPEMPRWSG